LGAILEAVDQASAVLRNSPPSPQPPADHARTATLPSGTETILVVEDESPIRRMVVEVLRECGYDALDAANGQEALLMAERYRGRVDLLLTDLAMPHMSGAELADRLVQRWPGMPVVYLCGQTAEALARQGVRTGNFFLVTKPFTAFDLASTVRRALDAR
jgi:CheY-like chemotaxis protein